MTETPSCPLAHSDAAYVLGALSPTERLEFERHLPTCAACRRSIAQLAGMPGLLARVPVEAVEDPEPVDPVPPTVLPALVSRVRREQRRRTVLLSLGAAAAVAAVAVGAAAFQATRDDSRLPEAVPSSTAPSVAPFQDMDVVINYGMTAKVSLTPGTEGTSLLVNCAYAKSQDGNDRTYHYELVLVTRDGVRHPRIMQWKAGSGDNLRGISGWTDLQIADIKRVEVVGERGDAILQLDL